MNICFYIMGDSACLGDVKQPRRCFTRAQVGFDVRQWYHSWCFVALPRERSRLDQLVGFSKLGPEHKAELYLLFPPDGAARAGAVAPAFEEVIELA